MCFFRIGHRVENQDDWLRVTGEGGRGRECLIGWLVLDEVRGKEGGREEGVRLWGFVWGRRGGEEGAGMGVRGMSLRCEENGEWVDLLGGVKCYVLLHEVGLDVDVDVDARCGEVVFGVTVGGWCWASGRSRCEEGLFESTRVVGDGRRGRYGRGFSGL